MLTIAQAPEATPPPPTLVDWEQVLGPVKEMITEGFITALPVATIVLGLFAGWEVLRRMLMPDRVAYMNYLLEAAQEALEEGDLDRADSLIDAYHDQQVALWLDRAELDEAEDDIDDEGDTWWEDYIDDADEHWNPDDAGEAAQPLYGDALDQRLELANEIQAEMDKEAR